MDYEVKRKMGSYTSKWEEKGRFPWETCRQFFGRNIPNPIVLATAIFPIPNSQCNYYLFGFAKFAHFTKNPLWISLSRQMGLRD
uniref:Uncharacterized protein n=1 Tax=Solanum lycopersicum TaxID=4081 RepID=A0A3Q7HMR1_SOLLC